LKRCIVSFVILLFPCKLLIVGGRLCVGSNPCQSVIEEKGEGFENGKVSLARLG
jgi:hypothetical protein